MSATWLYDATVRIPAYILRQNFDPYHEAEYDPDPPTLNEKGESYSLVFGTADTHGLFPSERPPLLTVEEALKLAEDDFGLYDWKLVDPPQKVPSG